MQAQFCLTNDMNTPNGRHFDAYTSRGAFAALVYERKQGGVKVFWNSSGTRGSARTFPDIQAALDFVAARRARKFGEAR